MAPSRSRFLTNPAAPQEEGRGLPAYLFVRVTGTFTSSHRRDATVSIMAIRPVRRHGREKFRFAIVRPLMVGDGAG